MKVADILPLIKANRYTYRNLDATDINMFKDLYNYILKHKNDYIGGILIDNQINTINNEYTTDYLRKYKTMQLISHNILIHNTF